MSKPCNKPATNPLPDFHFAILFEGAWIFTPCEGNQILATCPITGHMNDMHASQFGVWNNECQRLDDVPGFCDKDVSLGDSFTVSVSGICHPGADFSTLFNQAAMRYPFVHIPGSVKSPKIAADGTDTPVRQVTIPIPTEMRAAGALMTAEVGGNGTGNLFGGQIAIKRAFVDFIFIFEYEDSLTAEICRKRGGDEQRGCIHAPYSVHDPNPHLIFDIFPTREGMAKRFPGSFALDQSGNPGDPDQSVQKLHVTETFDLLRRSLPLVTPASTPCCDISIYHNEDDMFFDCGDVGLSECELGLDRKCDCEVVKGVKLPSCASGGISGGG